MKSHVSTIATIIGLLFFLAVALVQIPLSHARGRMEGQLLCMQKEIKKHQEAIDLLQLLAATKPEPPPESPPQETEP